MTNEERVAKVIELIEAGESERSACEAAGPKASIYGLYDKAGRLRYIGKANNPVERLKGHMRDGRKRKTPLYDWIRKHGEPEMRVLESDCVDWKEAERRLIREARERGEKLLNLADGGDQPFCPTEVRSENAKKLNRRFKGLEPWPEESLTREALIKDTYNWLAIFAQERGMWSLAARVEMKKRELYREDPKTFKAWKPKCQPA